jgi:Protein of unknown function (DUF2778)
VRFFVGAVVGAAAVAGGFTLGVEAQHPSRPEIAISRPSSDAEQRADEPERPASSNLPIGGPKQNIGVALSEANASAYRLARLALWNEVVLFRRDLLGGAGNRNSAGAANSDSGIGMTHPEKSVALPKSRPGSEKIAASNVAAAVSSPDVVAAPQPSSIIDLFEKFFVYAPKKAAQFPAEASGRTAVYDIETRAVYLPTGEILEAHSGLAEHMDDIRYVQTKSRGPTPPNVYQLSLREKPFHGVQAIRLTPLASSQMFGRDGILAHPYMLGPNGQSNGCVSIQEYPKFLEAYLKGQVDRLIVVPSLAAAPDVINASAAGSVRRASL